MNILKLTNYRNNKKIFMNFDHVVTFYQEDIRVASNNTESITIISHLSGDSQQGSYLTYMNVKETPEEIMEKLLNKQEN